MPLKKHHKWVIGSFSSLIVIFMIVNSLLIFTLFTRMELNYNKLNTDIKETQNNINTLTKNLIQTRETVGDTLDSLESLNIQVGSINEEFDMLGEELDTLKASAGEDFSGVIEDAVKGVVTIRTDVGQGTGFIITNNGYIVTNAHVLVGGRAVEAITYDQEIVDAEFIDFDGDFDIALLKINGTYEKLRLANSENVREGEKVIAIGNPLGLQFSVSQGIVSGKERPGPTGIEAYIQTDAPLNKGNSGGPLINTDGKVIGINNFKVGGSEGLGFALESNYIKEVVNKIFMEEANQTLI